MKRILSVLVIAAVLVLVFIGVINFYDASLSVGRMWQTPAIRPYEQPIPVRTAVSVPVEDGEVFDRLADPENLQPPFTLSDPAVIQMGQQGYNFYCIQCHGKHHDGLGTVGQSFAPLPGDLRSAKIQNMAAGRIFHEISYGIPGGRQPALDTTIAVRERWQIIGYVKSLGIRP